MAAHSLSILSPLTPSSSSPSTSNSLSSSPPLLLHLSATSRRNPNRSAAVKPLHHFLSPPRVSSFFAPSPSRPSDEDDDDEESTDVKKFVENSSIKDFMRFRKPKSENGDGDGVDVGELQTAVVSYRKKFPWSILRPFLQVDLVSTIHIADEKYFATLQKELESYDCVLYEMVTDKESLEERRSAAAKKESSRFQGFSIVGFIQRFLAQMLALDFQLDCLDYGAKNWYHADLDVQAFEALQSERGESMFTFAKDMTLEAAENIMLRDETAPWKSKLLWASGALPMPLVFSLIIAGICSDDAEGGASENSELDALTSLDFRAAMKLFVAKRLTSELTQETAGVEAESVIIGERNKAATEALRRAIDEGHNRIGILYGGGHMPDLGRRLLGDFNLVPTRVRWITAWAIRKSELQSNSLPFLKTMAEISGWPLNRYQTLTVLLVLSVLALDLWWWNLTIGTAVQWISEIASNVAQYIDNQLTT